VSGGRMCDHENRKLQSIMNKFLYIPYRCLKFDRRMIMVVGFCFILLELRVSLLGHALFF
jgi:hypothetical protein